MDISNDSPTIPILESMACNVDFLIAFCNSNPQLCDEGAELLYRRIHALLFYETISLNLRLKRFVNSSSPQEIYTLIELMSGLLPEGKKKNDIVDGLSAMIEN